MRKFSKTFCLLLVTLLSVNLVFAISPIKLQQPIDINLGDVEMDVTDNHPFKEKIGDCFSNAQLFRVNSGYKFSLDTFIEKICIIEFHKKNHFLLDKVLRKSVQRFNSKLFITICIIRI